MLLSYLLIYCLEFLKNLSLLIALISPVKNNKEPLLEIKKYVPSFFFNSEM